MKAAARPALLLSLLLAGSVLLGAGCARRQVSGEVVRSVHFRGNRGALQGTSDYGLRAAMAQESSGAFSWLAPSRRVALDRDTLLLDAWRLETWLAHRGYFDARFRAWDIVTLRPANKSRGPVVRIVGYVDPGPASVVRSLELGGMDIVGAPLLRLLRVQAPLQEGARFDLDDLDESVALAESRLREQSYAYATVQPEVEAYPEEHVVDVVLSAELGPPCTFGEISIVGETRLPDHLIRAEIDIEPGRSFQVSRLAETQQRLFSLGTFSVVNIVPELTYDAAGNPVDVVPVRIEVSESRFRQLRIGGGLSVENARQQLSAGASLSHVNVLNRLWRLEVGAEAGYASLMEWSQYRELGASGLLSEGGPIAVVSAGLDIPRFPARAWRLENDVSFELGVEAEYRFATPQGSTALAWQMSRRWSSRLGYAIRFFDYFDSDLPEQVTLADRSRDLGLDFSDPYLLSFIFQQLKYDSRDDLLYPRRGAYTVLDLAEAGGPVGGQYNFVKGTIDGRIYRPLPTLLGWRQRVTLTARLGGGAVVPYGAEARAKVPFAERIRIGGSSTVRGWERDHLGPYIYERYDQETEEYVQYSSAVSEDQPHDDDIIFIGGRAALYGGVEARGYWLNGVGLAVFSDFGRAWDGAGVSSLKDLEARLSQIAVSVGLGLRYRSPVGPIRLDYARRLDAFPMFSDEPRYQVHFGLSEAW